MTLTDLIARAWEQERARYEVMPIGDDLYGLFEEGRGCIEVGSLDDIEDKLPDLCAAAVEKALADAGYVVVPPRPPRVWPEESEHCMSAMWKSIETAPTDGTWIQAHIPTYGSDYVIAWTNDLIGSDGEPAGGWQIMSEQEPPECWTDGICWEINEDENRSMHPTKWKPLP